MTKYETFLVSAYTGVMLCEDSDYFFEQCEKKLGRPIFTHEYATPKVVDELKAAVKEELFKICMEAE